jgi:hypothetical protein
MKAVIEKLEAVPEALRGEYRQDEAGRFVLNVEPAEGYTLENTAGLKNALADEKTARREAAKRAQALEAEQEKLSRKLESLQGVTPENVQKRIEEVRQAVAESSAKEIAARDARLMEKDRQIEDYLVGGEITREVAKADGNIELLMPHVRGRVRLVDADGGKKAVEVLAQNGKPLYKSDGTPGTIADIIPEFVQRFPGAFKASGATGSGAQGSATGSAGGRKVSQDEYDKMDGKSRHAFVLAGGSIL